MGGRIPDRAVVPLRRLLLLTVATAAFAFAIQALLAASDPPAAGGLVLLLVPAAAAAIVFVGTRPYPLAGRIRLGVMVAVGLLLGGGLALD